ncbi:hypothetical protein UY3_07221 [Chelonia mydas]|uniref:Uncharacterized protein n=1 Tax=Chelonia mydas TaxID=8469 RepID=M7BU26_CHEMY|nr:hypothetical protein UY3_07221 [Chelonia mydas]
MVTRGPLGIVTRKPSLLLPGNCLRHKGKKSCVTLVRYSRMMGKAGKLANRLHLQEELGPQSAAATLHPPSFKGSSAEVRKPWYGIATLNSALLLVGGCLQSWAPGKQLPLSATQL